MLYSLLIINLLIQLLSINCYKNVVFQSKIVVVNLSRKEFQSLESEPNIVFLENILYKRIKEYRNNYIYSGSHKMVEIMENINKYILYPLTEIPDIEEDNKMVDFEFEPHISIDEDVIDEEINEEDGYHVFSMEKMSSKKKNID